MTAASSLHHSRIGSTEGTQPAAASAIDVLTTWRGLEGTVQPKWLPDRRLLHHRQAEDARPPLEHEPLVVEHALESIRVRCKSRAVLAAKGRPALPIYNLSSWPRRRSDALRARGPRQPGGRPREAASCSYNHGGGGAGRRYCWWVHRQCKTGVTFERHRRKARLGGLEAGGRQHVRALLLQQSKVVCRGVDRAAAGGGRPAGGGHAARTDLPPRRSRGRGSGSWRRSRFQKLTEQSSFVRRTETGDFWFEVGPRDHHCVISRRSTCAGSPARAVLCRDATKCKKRATVRAPSLSSELSPHRPLPTFVGHSRV